jgi:hypothetical protein
MIANIEIPVPVVDYAHWRVNFRPIQYKELLIPTLEKCYEIIDKNKLSLRGWDYPHLGRRAAERAQGNNWVASWSDFKSHCEYWRFYQSGQFIHLFSVRGEKDTEWRKKLQDDMRDHLSHRTDIAWENVPGYVSTIEFVHNITEIYEFAARLCQSQIYSGTINIQIQLKGIRGFILSASWERNWFNHYAAGENILTNSADFESDQLVATSREAALNAIIWFFERFGWHNPARDTISHDQEDLVKGRF